METITAEDLIRETGRSYRFVKRRLADAGLAPVGRDCPLSTSDAADDSPPVEFAGTRHTTNKNT